MSTARDVLTGVADLLVTAGVATLSTSTPYAPTDTGLFFMTRPASPDRVVVLDFVPVTDDPNLNFGSVMVHVVCRAVDPLSCADLSDSVFDTLHGLMDIPLGACHATQINRRTSVPIGQDESKRYERSDTYLIDLDYAPTSLRPDGGSW